MATGLRSSDAMKSWVRSRLSLAAIILAVLVASCGGQPGVKVSVAGAVVPMVLSSRSEGTPCSGSVGDAFPQEQPLTTVRGQVPVTFQFEAGDGATGIRGWIYDVDRGPPSGGPLEEFALPGRRGSYQTRSILPARTYMVMVNVAWSLVVAHGEETNVFRLRVEPGG